MAGAVAAACARQRMDKRTGTKKGPHSWNSRDWLCSSCRTMNYGSSMFCPSCRHQKPTLNTMGPRCYEFYPYGHERTLCSGERICPACHGSIHASHKVCLGCKNYNAQFEGAEALAFQAEMRGVRPVTLSAPGASPGDSAGGSSGSGIPNAAPRNEFEQLQLQYDGMSPEAVLDDILKKQAGEKDKESTGKEEEDDSELKAYKEKLQREAAAREALAKQAELLKAKNYAARVVEKLDKRRDAASDRIAAMLEADEREAAAAEEAETTIAVSSASTPAPQQCNSGSVASTSPAAKAALTVPMKRKADDSGAKDDRVKKRAEMRKKQEEEERLRREKQKGRRLQKLGKSADAGASEGTECAVVELDL